MAVGLLDSVTAQKLLLDKIQLNFQLELRDFPAVAQNMELSLRQSKYAADHMTYMIKSFLTNVKREDTASTTLFKYPATPWEFYKEKYAPMWFLKRWPVRYESEEVVTSSVKNFMCPHLVLSDNYPHAMWLMDGRDGRYSSTQ
jgi:hypothetical protein